MSWIDDAFNGAADWMEGWWDSTSFGSILNDVQDGVFSPMSVVPMTYRPALEGILSRFNGPSAVLEASEGLGDSLSEFLPDLFETEAEAARQQALRNEQAADNQWKRNERSAELAYERQRELRRTAYQDTVGSLKDAGLNPVLAAGGGISAASSSAPQATSSASSSGKAEGLTLSGLLGAVAQLLTGAGSLVGQFLPSSAFKINGQTGELQTVTRTVRGR